MDLKKKALQLIAARFLHSAELKKKLQPLGSSEEIDALLEEFEDLKLLNDSEWERSFLATLERGLKSSAYLKSKLYQRGFPRFKIEELAEEYSTREFKVLERLIEKEADSRDKKSLIRFLQSRGFPLDQIFSLNL